MRIRGRTASVNARDWRLFNADPFFVRFMIGLLKPRRSMLGPDVAGTVESIGSEVKRFTPGDEVFGYVSGLLRTTFVVASVQP